MSLYRDSSKFHSANLYQLMSYLTNSQDAAAERSEGMLIYPRVDRTLRGKYVILGYPVTVATVDLSAELADIRGEILQLVAGSIKCKRRRDDACSGPQN